MYYMFGFNNNHPQIKKEKKKKIDKRKPQKGRKSAVIRSSLGEGFVKLSDLDPVGDTTQAHSPFSCHGPWARSHRQQCKSEVSMYGNENNRHPACALRAGRAVEYLAVTPWLKSSACVFATEGSFQVEGRELTPLFGRAGREPVLFTRPLMDASEVGNENLIRGKL